MILKCTDAPTLHEAIDRLQKHLAEAQQRHATAHAIAVEKGETIDALREKLSEVTAERDRFRGGCEHWKRIGDSAQAELSKPSPAWLAMKGALEWEQAVTPEDKLPVKIRHALKLANQEHPEK